MPKHGTIAGVVESIGDVQRISERFSKRELVLETGDTKYPQIIPIEATGDMIDKAGALAAGDHIEVGFELRGRRWNGRTFCNVRALYIAAAKRAGDAPAAPPPSSAAGFDALPDDGPRLPF